MTEISRPWDGISTGDAGPYSSENWALSWRYLSARGAGYPNAGPFLGTGTAPNNGLKVQAQSPAAAAVDVLIGSALVAGRWYLNDATKALTIAANASGNPRIDTIILRADYSLQTVVLAVLQGTPAGSPTPPTLTQTAGVLWEIPLADVAVANGFTSIANTDITPRSEWANAPHGAFLIAQNNSGGTLTDGQVVIWDTSADRAITTTTSVNHARVAGVVRGRIANGAYGLIQTEGVGFVVVNAALSRGTGLTTSTTAGRAGTSSGSGNPFGNIGVMLAASSGAGELVQCFINVVRRQTSIAVYSNRQTSGTTGPNYTNGTNTAVLNTEVSDPDGIGALASNQVTIQPGLYRVTGWIAYSPLAARQSRVLVYDVGAASNVIIGLNAQGTTGVQIWPAVVEGYLAVAAATAYELRVWMSGNSGGATAAVTSGDQENYAQLTFERLG